MNINEIKDVVYLLEFTINSFPLLNFVKPVMTSESSFVSSPIFLKVFIIDIFLPNVMCFEKTE